LRVCLSLQPGNLLFEGRSKPVAEAIAALT
jgi:hypothetical protein